MPTPFLSNSRPEKGRVPTSITATIPPIAISAGPQYRSRQLALLAIKYKGEAALTQLPIQPLSHTRARASAAIAVAIALSLLAGGPALAADAPSVEVQVKSAFIVNFVQFIDWPAETFSKPNDPIVLGIVGQDPIDAALAAAIEGKTVRGRPLVLKHFKPGEVGPCQVLFIGASAADQAPAIIKALGNAPTLTIGDKEGLIDSGGIIRFFGEDHKLRFEINQTAAERIHLQVSAKLLKLAKVVNK